MIKLDYELFVYSKGSLISNIEVREKSHEPFPLKDQIAASKTHQQFLKLLEILSENGHWVERTKFFYCDDNARTIAHVSFKELIRFFNPPLLQTPAPNRCQCLIL